MLAFTVRMIIADVQKSFRGIWIVLYLLCLGFIIIAPFFDFSIVITQMLILVFPALEPHITKIFYVLPLGEKLVRRYLHLRTLVLSLLFIMLGSIMVLISYKWHIPNVEMGLLMIMFYVMLSISINFFNTRVTIGKSKKRQALLLAPSIILFSAGLLSAIFIINFRIQLLISLAFIFVIEILFIVWLRGIELTNYTEPIYYGLFTKAWRDQQRLLTAEAESKRAEHNTSKP